MLKARAPQVGQRPSPLLKLNLARVASAGATAVRWQTARECCPTRPRSSRVGARRLADGRLVHKHHIGQVVRAQQAVVRAGASVALPNGASARGEHVLDQAGFARAAHARHRHQPLQRKLDRHILQVVLARAFQDEARGVRIGDHAPAKEPTRLRPPR